MFKMDMETFRKGKAKIRIAWPEDRIVSEEQNRITVQCENGAYLRYSRFELPEELKETPAAAMFQGKVMIQFTEDLKAETYDNVTAEIAGKREAKGRVLEALKEFSFRIRIGDVLVD